MTRADVDAILFAHGHPFPPQTVLVPLERAQGCPVCGRVSCVIVVRQTGRRLAWSCAPCDLSPAKET